MLIVDSLNYVVREVDMTCPLGFAPENGAGQCVLPASSLAAIILVGALTPLLCILACCCALMVYMARKERREEAERLEKVSPYQYTDYQCIISTHLPYRQQKRLVSRLSD